MGWMQFRHIKKVMRFFVRQHLPAKYRSVRFYSISLVRRKYRRGFKRDCLILACGFLTVARSPRYFLFSLQYFLTYIHWSSFFISPIIKEHHRHEPDGLLTNRDCRGRPRPQHYFGKRRWRTSGASRRRNRNGREKVGLDRDS